MKAATIDTLVFAGQKVLGRKSRRCEPNQCQAPLIGTEVFRVIASSTPLRALIATGSVKVIEIGIATPTVVSESGAMPSRSIGGPVG